MIQKYPLEWLDSLISLTLNPAKIYLQDLTREHLQQLTEKAIIETVHIQSELKNQVFSLHKESQIRLLVQKYHSALIILLDTVMAYREDKAFEHSDYSNLAKTLISCLDELLFFIENRFADFLGLEERVPVTYLEVSRKELKIKLDRLQKKLVKDVADPCFTGIVLEQLQRFINSRNNEGVTFRDLLYRRELVHKLDLLGKGDNRTSIYSSLNELLIYMNFNSRHYIRYFTRTLADKINTLEDKAERLDSLHFHYKEFRQLQCHQNMILFPQQQGLKTVVGNWFEHEITYLEKTLTLHPDPVRGLKKVMTPLSVAKKVKVNISTDQIALFLRACDESRLIEARSLSQVFRQIVPHLATPAKTELSYDSVRSKSYNAEERDKEALVLLLQKIITKVKSY